MPNKSTRKSHHLLPLLIAAAATLTGCAKYAITDPSSGTTYYTDKYDTNRNDTITFKDRRDDAKVSLKQYEVRKISGDEYQQGLKSPVRATPEPSNP